MGTFIFFVFIFWAIGRLFKKPEPKNIEIRIFSEFDEEDRPKLKLLKREE